MNQLFLSLGALAGFTSVMLGAFAAHGLKESLAPASLSTFQTAAQYQMYHALVLVFVSFLIKQTPSSTWLTTSGWFFVAGIILFCGSLYALALTEHRIFGPITPIGGLCFLLGWASLFIAAIKTN